jgi:hypothetical protein
MNLFVRYQERIVIKKGIYIMVNDALIPMVEFGDTFLPTITAESLLNNMRGSNDAMANPEGWQDNGVDAITHAKLEHRVLAAVADVNYADVKKKLWECPDDKTLLENYYKACDEFHLIPAKPR